MDSVDLSAQNPHCNASLFNEELLQFHVHCVSACFKVGIICCRVGIGEGMWGVDYRFHPVTFHGLKVRIERLVIISQKVVWMAGLTTDNPLDFNACNSACYFAEFDGL